MIELLYSGQVGQHKGVHTIIDALHILINEHEIRNIHLDIVGPTPFPEYTARLESAITEHRLTPYVNFVGKVSRRDLVSLYHTHDILLFPSIWPEPFSITILEVMAAKLPIIATSTGGSAEILIHGENCLTFPPDDSIALARCIYDLIHDESARRIMTDRAYTLIQQHFDIRDIVVHIAEFLDEVCHYYREHENI
jgi:glycosyltransferase involved in cell wall biosynthesis